MLIIPAVDIKNGNCVQLIQGKPGTEQVVLENPQEIAKCWENKGANTLHIIDLDGALGTRDNTSIIKKIVEIIEVPIQMGGGIRDINYAKKLLDIGIDRIIIGTMAIKEPESIKKLSDEYGKERIMISLDSKDNKVVIKGWTEKTNKSATEFGKFLEQYGAGSILFTNVDYEGLLKGFNEQPVIDLVNAVNIPVVYSGGISTINDIEKLQSTGVKGIVVGSAIYKGTIDFEEALKYEDL